MERNSSIVNNFSPRNVPEQGYSPKIVISFGLQPQLYKTGLNTHLGGSQAHMTYIQVVLPFIDHLLAKH
jgi:hypothetical protein